MKSAIPVFFCPSTGPHAIGSVRKDPDGTLWHLELVTSAKDRAENKTSYHLLGWFADMENLWNGNLAYKDNSRFVRKTVKTIESYVHEHEAFGLEGSRGGPATTWVFTDSDPILPSPFWPAPENNHGDRGVNTGFLDGHVEWLAPQRIIFSYERSQDNNRTRALPRL